jgi:hypothetical protein
LDHLEKEEKAQLPFFNAQWLLLVKDFRDLMNPSIHLLQGFPLGFAGLQTFLENVLEAF